MTVAELIKELARLDQMDIVCTGGEEVEVLILEPKGGRVNLLPELPSYS